MQVEQVQKALEFKEKKDFLTEAQAEHDLMRLDPNVALRLGLNKGQYYFPQTSTAQESEYD